jgi:hypothetical protein
MITKNILYKYFKDFADNHLQIKDYGYGDLWEISSSQATTYPLFWVSPQPSNISGNEISYNFNILIGDRLEDGDANKVEVESDTFQIGLDLLATLNLDRELDLDKNNTLTPFIHDFKDRIAGHLITLSVSAPFDYNECAVPTTGTPQPPASSCPVAIITINGVTYGSVASGGTEDIAVIDGFGTPVGSLVSGNWVVTASCPNASAVLKNTLGTTLSTTSIASGGSSDITAPDSTITINSASFSPYPSGATSNILVKDGTGTQVGSKVGSEWIVPASSYNVGSTDRFGNVLPTIIVNSNTTLNWRSYDFADAFLSLLTAPSGTIQSAVRTLVDDLIASGVWDNFYGLYPLVNGNSTDHSYNLKYPFASFQNAIPLSFVGSPTHNSNGVTLASTAQSIVTAISPSFLDWHTGGHISYYFRTYTAINNNIDAQATLDSRQVYWHLNMPNSGSGTNVMALCNATSFQNPNPALVLTGHWMLNRSNSTTVRQTRNGVLYRSQTVTGDGPFVGTAAYSRLLLTNGDKNVALISIGRGLTTTQEADFYTAVQAFQTTLGRQI